MEIRTCKEGNRVTVEVIGTIDTTTSADLNRVLLALDYSDLDLTLDFKETRYITSAGLRVLLVARKKLSDETMRLIHVNDAIREVFEMTGFAQMLNFSGDTAELDEESFHLSFKALLKKKMENPSDLPIFVSRGREYTWTDVEKASQIIADDLAKVGVGKGSHVGIASFNSVNWIFTFFAIQKLGGIAVLVNFGLKPQELIAVSQIGGITHMCFGDIPGLQDRAAYAQALMGPGSPVRFTYDMGSQVDFTARFGEYEAVREKYSELYHGDDASVIIFSSGSTGRPKAILSSSYNLLSCLTPIVREFRAGHEDRNLAFLPFFHVFGFVTCIGLSLMQDLTSYIPQDAKPQTMIDMIDTYKCTLFQTVPTMVLAMTQCPGFTPEKVASLRVSLLGGSATTESQMHLLRKLFPNNHFGNIYGMSENGAISLTAYEDTVEHITKTVGKPVAGLEMEIRDVTTGKPLPPGEQGEVCIRSDSMVVCYYNLAIEAQPLDDEGWLATGDLGVIQPDGYLKLVGRSKDLIIRGGENISPGEVADALAALPQVADVKVLGVPHPIMGEEVAAVLILREGATFDPQATREVLEEKLAKYKIPSHYIIRTAFPLLGSGKVDAITLKKEVLAELEARGELGTSTKL